MSNSKMNHTRRDFLLKSGIFALPFLTPTQGLGIDILPHTEAEENQEQTPISFFAAGLYLSPQQYLEKLNQINSNQKIASDSYGKGGITQKLEEAFEKQTQKEAAIYMPSGTMANQLAMKLLNGQNTKVIVPENSHIFRDEADAAQSVHNLRLVPIGKDKPYFDAEDLKRNIDTLNRGEVFKSGLGTVVIESPVRRANQVAVPIKVIEEISSYCKQYGYKLHLDGSRLHLAAAFTKVPIAEYASHFDTVYISLYKCLNAAGGAILCGNKEIISQLDHQIKILGGTMFQSWLNTSIAHHYLEGIEERFSKVEKAAQVLITKLNKIEEINISPIQDGTYVFKLELPKKVGPQKLREVLAKNHSIYIGIMPGDKVRFAVNEGILTRDLDEIVEAWRDGIKSSIGY